MVNAGRKTLACFLILLAATPGPGAEGAGKPTKIFILAGQSNCVGKGNADDLPPDLAAPPAETMLYQNSSGMKGWQPLGPYPSDPGQAKMYGCGGGMFGPEIGFGHAIRKQFPNDRIGIVKVCVGGTSVASWSKDIGSPANRAVMEAVGYKDIPGSKSLYALLLAEVRAALAAGEGGFEVAGFVWVQAERDSQHPMAARAWPERVLQLHNDLAADIGYSAGIPLVVMTPHIQAMEVAGSPAATALLEGMKKAAEEGGAVTLERVAQLAGLRDAPPRDLDNALKAMRAWPPMCWTQIECVGIMNRGLREIAAKNANVTIVESGDLPTCEGLHFNSAGLIELGRRLANALQGAGFQPGKPPQL